MAPTGEIAQKNLGAILRLNSLCLPNDGGEPVLLHVAADPGGPHVSRVIVHDEESVKHTGNPEAQGEQHIDDGLDGPVAKEQ